ncbi:hypothetical protein H310_07367 [Aphanomyces invadans]|uniref:Uncharacterized protein n=1 Tax=Aphanomyces invadans TaxID=157072 RepID=A0A024U352_9STRA|nr:hypothetical protein H310_07367 [Aphanomyces invadans]ETW00841.1 hypothetical protein H310_07367 [Aphanomyces invadans]|eukprot:XP_008870976.1 hypothetical protein H310_07367 [Aphanomyces invadans]
MSTEKKENATMAHVAVYHVSLAYNLIMNKATSRTWWTRITDNLILGALPLRDRGHLAQLKEEERVAAVVTMNQPYELQPSILGIPVSPDDWHDAGIAQCFGHTQDFSPPTLATLIECVEFTKQHIDQGDTVYVHCKAGRGRSTIVVAAYLMQANGWPVDEALAFIKAKRPHIALQKPLLHEYSKHLAAQHTDVSKV